ncbi:hypothetical protein HYV82_00090 [Candidatus Woesearchaeota archaeon]|nr:hypothetical protein [Candidatus Woesearchaeota archaeon]
MINKAKHNWEIIAVILIAALVVFNSLQILSVSAALGGNSITGLSFGSSGKSSTFKVKSGGDVVQNVIDAIIPKGTPAYGEELGVSFDEPVTSLEILARLERKVVGTKISCEFCCGAPSVIDGSGRNLCGCSHAASFQGLSKYLIKNHPDEWTDEQILAELTKWKALYYPKNMVEKGIAAVENGLALTPAVLNDRDLLKKLKTGDTSKIGTADLPTMVGGC